MRNCAKMRCTAGNSWPGSDEFLEERVLPRHVIALPEAMVHPETKTGRGSKETSVPKQGADDELALYAGERRSRRRDAEMRSHFASVADRCANCMAQRKKSAGIGAGGLSLI